MRVSLEQDLTQRDLDILYMEEQLAIYQQKLEHVQSLLYKTVRDINRRKWEKAEQKRCNIVVVRNSDDTLKIMSANLEKLREETGNKLCNELFSQCQQMRKIIAGLN